MMGTNSVHGLRSQAVLRPPRAREPEHDRRRARRRAAASLHESPRVSTSLADRHNRVLYATMILLGMPVVVKAFGGWGVPPVLGVLLGILPPAALILVCSKTAARRGLKKVKQAYNRLGLAAMILLAGEAISGWGVPDLGVVPAVLGLVAATLASRTLRCVWLNKPFPVAVAVIALLLGP